MLERGERVRNGVIAPPLNSRRVGANIRRTVEKGYKLKGLVTRVCIVQVMVQLRSIYNKGDSQNEFCFLLMFGTW